MSKKNLLNEATIRRFMKLANMAPLAEPFVGRLDEMGASYGMQPGARDEDEAPAPADMADEDPMDAAPEAPEVEMDLDAPEGDEDAQLEPGVRARVEDALADALEALAAELGDSLGVELDVEADADEPDMEVPADMDPEPADEMTEVEDTPLEEEEVLAEVEVVDDDFLVNEVAKRVTARLVKAMANKR